jgi:hypothetical protein
MVSYAVYVSWLVKGSSWASGEIRPRVGPKTIRLNRGYD